MVEGVDFSEEINKEAESQPLKVPKEIVEKEEDIAEAVSEIPLTSVPKDELDVRKEKVINFLKNPKVWVSIFLVIAIILGVYIRSMPMHIREDTGKPGLWDITTDSWSLGPDLDPWLFLRTAKSIAETGGVPEIDTMRNVPVGFENSKETKLLSYMIVWTYYLSSLFYSGATVTFAGALLPVIMFIFTIIAFYLFVREVFTRESKESKTKANIISLISTFFMIVIPVFLSRTIAGIPEKESAGFFFMFLSYYLFLKAWKTKKPKTSYILGFLAGLSTALMGLIWGGVIFVYIAIAGAVFIAFILDKIQKREFIAYSLWVWTSIILTVLFTNRATLIGLITSLSSGLAFLIFFITSVHFTLWKTKLSQKAKKFSGKIPKNIFSLIVAGIVLILLGSILFGPGFIIEKVKVLHQTIFKPITGRWNTTVAENRQPYFREWAGSFGPFVQGIPLMFWMFLLGSVMFFKKALRRVNKGQAWLLTLSFILILLGMIFTRYSEASVFNGENFVSKAVYYLVILIFFALLYLFYYYFGTYKKEGNGFEKIRFESIFLLTLFLLGIFSARGAVRTIMVLGPIAPIFAGFLIVESVDKFRKSKEETGKMFWGIFGVVIIIASLFTFNSYYETVKFQAENQIPSIYNQQWQKAMSWVRENTSEDAVFAHWWDYGYWVQSIGERSTITDGGNAITFWNYYMGRLVLTGDNQDDALDFLYSHEADYLLIDSTDIGKYGAYSSIGSDENFDRFSWIPTLNKDSSQSVETSEGMIMIYQGGSSLDEDIVYNNNGTEIFLPAKQAAIIGVIIESVQDNSTEGSYFKQPKAVFFYNGKNTQIPLRYIEFGGQFFDFGTGLEGTAKIVQRIDAGGNNGIKVDNLGSIIYISPRVMRGLFAQKYLLEDPLGNFPGFEPEYQEDNLIIQNLRNQGLNLDEFVSYGGNIQGPIKIWKINYTGDEEAQERYLDRDSSKYLSWKL